MERRWLPRFPAADKALGQPVRVLKLSPVHRDFPARGSGRLGQHAETIPNPRYRETSQSLFPYRATRFPASRRNLIKRSVGRSHAAPSFLDDLAGHARAVILDLEVLLARLVGTESNADVACKGVVGVLHQFHYGHDVVGHQIRSESGEHSGVNPDGNALGIARLRRRDDRFIDNLRHQGRLREWLLETFPMRWAGTTRGARVGWGCHWMRILDSSNAILEPVFESHSVAALRTCAVQFRPLP